MAIFFLSIQPGLLSSCRERLGENYVTGFSAGFQEAYPEDFSALLRLCHNPAESDCLNDSKNPRPFSILDF
jgi:hypothetical protein